MKTAVTILLSVILIAVCVDAQAQDVKVTLLDGPTERGALDSLTDTEVVLKERQEPYPGTGVIPGRVIALKEVRKVERVSHAVRNWVLSGIAAGVISSLVLHEVYPGADADGLLTLAFFTGIGAGAGVAVGTALSAVSRADRVMYLAPPSDTVRVTPISAHDRQGAGLTLSW